MYIVKHTDLIDASEPQLGTITECELFAEPDEELHAFYVDWSINGFSKTIYVPDNITEEDIELEAENYFTKVELEKLEIFIDEYGSSATVIEVFHKGLKKTL